MHLAAVVKPHNDLRGPPTNPFRIDYRPPTLEDIDRMVSHAVDWLGDESDEILIEAR